MCEVSHVLKEASFRTCLRGVAEYVNGGRLTNKTKVNKERIRQRDRQRENSEISIVMKMYI